VTVIVWKHTGSALYEIVPGFIAGTVAIVVVSLLGREPPPAVQATHEAVRAELQMHGH
jgi:sodium/proline symporter